MLLRGIAWAGHYPVETLVNGTAPARGVAAAVAGRAAGMRPPTGGPRRNVTIVTQG